VWDADDNRFIDYRLGFGPIILGHAYPEVNRRVADAIQHGVLFAATTPVEIELAERFTRMTGMDKVRLSNTGTEANMHALRIARAYTGREKFIKFEGNYHGNFDYVMFSGPTANAETARAAAEAAPPARHRRHARRHPQLSDLAALQRHRAARSSLPRPGRRAGRGRAGADHGQRGLHRARPRLAAARARTVQRNMAWC
jgi:glutamate-1-semialdehyde aminotransferase